MVGFSRLFDKKLTQRETQEGREKREQIIRDAQSMKRLEINPDFIRFCEMLEQDKQGLITTLINEQINNIQNNDQRTRLIARVNQIDKVLKKTKSLIWQMENLTEVRDAIKEQTRDRQAVGKKTGGQ